MDSSNERKLETRILNEVDNLKVEIKELKQLLEQSQDRLKK